MYGLILIKIEIFIVDNLLFGILINLELKIIFEKYIYLLLGYIV